MSFASCLTDVPHPGEFLREELEERGWSQRDFAFILGVPEQTINLILGGKRGISPEMAKALGGALDVSAEYFANLQKMYEMANAREPDPAIARRALLQGSYPIREMIRRGWLEDTDVAMLEAQMMRFFHVNDVGQIPHLAHAAKKQDYTETTPSQLAWLFRVKQIAAEMVVPTYSESKLKALVAEFPRYMMDPEEIRHVPRLLGDCGVRFAVVETLPKANIDGVCFWLDDAPVIGLTTRFDRIDNFWFVLGHECAHALNGDGRDEPMVDVDLEGEAAGQGDDLPLEERKANAAAANLCVPADDLESFYIRKNPYFYERDVLGFARRLQRHPGIVVGQLQRRMGRYDYLTRHKVKIRQHLLPGSMVDGWGVAAPVTL
ncbi:HigA family addiction module antitoxin [Phenylobacterium sp.]|uniref:HigA family addiction module antitoxin n=1 Tax=Phenylobacterium sp. TaxID=1871053 RepID=UPI00120D0BAB|nr:HigA family addiction module antitoxin [Phenylobacterium sp.]THD63001.1 MAG: addiction module antidote protein, HigA family [Phenylobacterium sp.]